MHAVEVLWTPQNENDTLSKRELLEDFKKNLKFTKRKIIVAYWLFGNAYLPVAYSSVIYSKKYCMVTLTFVLILFSSYSDFGCDFYFVCYSDDWKFTFDLIFIMIEKVILRKSVKLTLWPTSSMKTYVLCWN